MLKFLLFAYRQIPFFRLLYIIEVCSLFPVYIIPNYDGKSKVFFTICRKYVIFFTFPAFFVRNYYWRTTDDLYNR